MTLEMWNDRVLVAYPGKRSTTQFFWIEQFPAEREACFLVAVASPLAPGTPVDGFVLEFYEEVERFLPPDLKIVKHRVSFGVFDNRYEVVQPAVEFMTPDAWALIISLVLLRVWVIGKGLLSADVSGPWTATLDQIDSTLWGILGNALYGFCVVCISYWVRRRQARRNRKVVYRP